MTKYLFRKKVVRIDSKHGLIKFRNKDNLKKFYALLVSKTWKAYYPHEPERKDSYCMIGTYQCSPDFAFNFIHIADLR